MVNASSVATVKNQASTAGVTLNNVSKIVALELNSAQDDTTINYTATTVSGAADTQNVTLNGANTTASGTLTVNGIETLAVTASGTNSGSTTNSFTVTGDANLKSVTIAGDKNASINLNLDAYASATNTGTVNAGSATGNITTTVTATLGDKLSVTGGAGNDAITINTLGGTATVAGGSGIDTLKSSQTTLTQTDLTNVSGIEKFSLAASSAVDVTKQASELTDVIYASGTGASTLTGVKSGLTITQQAAGTSLGVTVTGASTATTDSLNLVVGKTGTVAAGGTAGLAAGTLTATGVETIALTSQGADSDTTNTNTLTVAGHSVTTVTVAGAMNATLTQAGASITSYDASTATGKQNTASITFSTAGATVKGGSAADTLTTGSGADSVIGGAGNDTITAAAGNDTIDGGDGNDAITAGAGADNVTGGAGVDTFTIANGDSTSAVMDTIKDFVSGTDKLVMGQTNTKFIGNFSDVTTALAAMTGANQSFFVTGSNQLYVVATQGTLQTTDDVVKLEGVSSLSSADLQFGSQGTGNSITITAASATVTTSASTTSGATGPTSGLDDTITSQAQYVNTGTPTFDGGVGADKLVVTDGGGTLVTTAISSVETLDLSGASSATNTGTLNADFTTVIASAKGDTISMAATSSVSVTGGAEIDTITLATSTTTATVDGGAGNDVLRVVDVAGTSALRLADTSGTADQLTILANTNADLSGSTLTGIETLYLTDSSKATLTYAQYSAFSGISSDGSASNTKVDLTTAGTFTADSDVTHYAVAAGSNITLSAGAQSVDESGTGTTTINVAGLTATGTFANLDTGDSIVATTGASIAGVNSGSATGATVIDITGAVTMTEAQYDAFATITAAGSSDSVTIAGGAIATIAGNSAIESYIIGDDTGDNGFTVSGISGAQSVDVSASNDAGDAATVEVSGVYSGTLTGETALGADDIVSLATGTNIANATIGAGFVALTLANGGTATMTQAQWAAFTGTITATGANTVTLTTAGAVTTNSVVESYVLANGTNTVTHAGTAAATVTGGSGADTINVSALTTAKVITIDLGSDTVTDRISIDNQAITAIADGYVAVTNFNASHDAIKVWDDDDADVFFTGGTFQTVAAGSESAPSSLLGAIEIEGTNVVDLTAVTGGVANAIGAALGTYGAATVGGSWVIALYSGSDAGIYNVTWSDTGTADDKVTADELTVELVAVLTGVGADALGSSNFYQ